MSTYPRPNSCRPCARAVPHLTCLIRAEVSVSSAARLPLLLVTTYTQAATHMHTCTHMRMNTYIRSVHPRIHEYMHTYIHTHSPMHACHTANTHIHTYSVLQSIHQSNSVSKSVTTPQTSGGTKAVPTTVLLGRRASVRTSLFCDQRMARPSTVDSERVQSSRILSVR